MKYRKKMICLAAGLLVLTALAGCGKSEVVTDARQETVASGATETNANAGSGAEASGQAGQSVGKDTVAGAGENVQAAGVNASAPVSGGTSSGSTAAAGVANGVSTAGKSGWVEEKDGWHLYDAQGTSMTGWVENEGCRYYFDRDGRMLTDWQEIGGAWYYLGTDGKMQTDWQQVKGSWFYLGGDGAMRTGWQDIDGKRYYFEDSGAMLHDTTVGDYELLSDGSARERRQDTAYLGQYGRILAEYLYGYHAPDEPEAARWNDGYTMNYNSNLGRYDLQYRLTDINGDGMPELFVRQPWYDVIEGVFTFINGSLITAMDSTGEHYFKVSSWLTDRMYLVYDDSGAAWIIYRLDENGRLQEVDGRDDLRAAAVPESEKEAWMSQWGEAVYSGWIDVTAEEIRSTFGVDPDALGLIFVDPYVGGYD